MARLRAGAQAVAAAAEARYALEAFVLAELDAAPDGSEGWRGLLLAEEEWLWDHENATVVRAHSSSSSRNRRVFGCQRERAKPQPVDHGHDDLLRCRFSQRELC